MSKYVIYADIDMRWDIRRAYIGVDIDGRPILCSARCGQIFHSKEKALEFIEFNKGYICTRYNGLIVDNKLTIGELNINAVDYVFLNRLNDSCENNKNYIIWCTTNTDLGYKNQYLSEDTHGDMWATYILTEAHLYSLDEARDIVNKYREYISKVLHVADGVINISKLNMSINLGKTECH